MDGSSRSPAEVLKLGEGMKEISIKRIYIVKWWCDAGGIDEQNEEIFSTHEKASDFCSKVQGMIEIRMVDRV